VRFAKTIQASLLVGLVGILCAISVAGCSVFPRPPEKPSVSVRGVSLTAVSFGSVDGQLLVDVYNPTGFSVPLAAIDWQLAIGGAHAVSGRIDLHQEIPARGTAPVTVGLHIGVLDAAVVARAVAAGRTRYDLRGALTFSTPIGPIKVDVAHQGELGDAGRLAGR